MKSYLELQTGTMLFLIEMEQVQEVLTVAASLVVPIANMPKSLMGMLVYHQQVYWSLDLGKFMQLEPISNVAKYGITILSNYALAIATERIGTIKNLEYPHNSGEKPWAIVDPATIFGELDKLTRH